MRLYCFIKGVSFTAFAKTKRFVRMYLKFMAQRKTKRQITQKKEESVLLFFLTVYAQIKKQRTGAKNSDRI